MKTLFRYALAALFAGLTITAFEYSGKIIEYSVALKLLGCVFMLGFHIFANEAERTKQL